MLNFVCGIIMIFEMSSSSLLKDVGLYVFILAIFGSFTRLTAVMGFPLFIVCFLFLPHVKEAFVCSSL